MANAEAVADCVKCITEEDMQSQANDISLVAKNSSEKSHTSPENESPKIRAIDLERTCNKFIENGHIPSSVHVLPHHGVELSESPPLSVKAEEVIIPNSETTETFIDEDDDVVNGSGDCPRRELDIPLTQPVDKEQKETESSEILINGKPAMAEIFTDHNGTVPLLASSETLDGMGLTEIDANNKSETLESHTNTEMTNGTIPLLVPQGTIKNLDDVLSQLKFGFQVKMLMLTGGAYFAMCAQIMCIVFLSTPIKAEWNLSKYSFSWLPFSTGVSGIIGGFIIGTLSDRFGRQRPFLICMILCMIFGIASPFASSFGLLIAIRAFVSMAIGGLSAVNFVLLLEMLPRERRGCHMVVITLCGAMGAVLAGGLAWLLLEKYGWRIFLGSCAAPSVAVVILRLFVSYESPRYLLTSNQPEKALELLKTIAKNNRTTLPDVEISCPPSESRGRMQDLFTPKLRRRTVFTSLVWVFQSMGFWGVSMYMPEYMIKLGVDPNFSMFTIFIGEIPGLLFAMILIERHMFGRIRCLRFFSFCTMTCLIIFAVVNLDFLRAVFVVVCYFFMVPVYSILNTFTPEIYPTSLRSTAMAWMNIITDVPSLVTPFVGEILLSSSIPWLYPIVWATCFLLQFIFTFGLITETAGRNLDESPDDQRSESSQSGNSGRDMTEIRLRVGESVPSEHSDSIGCEIF